MLENAHDPRWTHIRKHGQTSASTLTQDLSWSEGATLNCQLPKSSNATQPLNLNESEVNCGTVAEALVGPQGRQWRRKNNICPLRLG